MNPFCKLVEKLYRHCSGTADQPEVPPRIREASHSLANEAMRVRQAAKMLIESADALTDLAEHMTPGGRRQ